MAKMFEDALRSLGILKDDTPAYVAESVLSSVVVRRPKGKEIARAQNATVDEENEDYVKITITPYAQHTDS